MRYAVIHVNGCEIPVLHRNDHKFETKVSNTILEVLKISEFPETAFPEQEYFGHFNDFWI